MSGMAGIFPFIVYSASALQKMFVRGIGLKTNAISFVFVWMCNEPYSQKKAAL